MIIIRSTFIVALALTALGQQRSFRSATNTVEVYATVTDRQGRQVTNLTQADFEIQDNGKTQPITVFDAGVQAIYVTEYKRTQETAAPLAKALGLTPIVVTAKDTPGLVEKLKAARSPVLVIGHSNSVPDVIKGLGVPTAPSIADPDYDNLFIVTETRQLIRLHFR